MKLTKKVLASLVMVGLISKGTAFAAPIDDVPINHRSSYGTAQALTREGIADTGTAHANPFDDVPKDHWSYDAVQTLVNEGIIDGFTDNTFRGDKVVTRYEMAQLVGRAVAKEKLASEKDKVLIEKLSKEYADELQSLGVRVANLEKKTAGVSDVKVSHWFQTENTYGKNYDGSDLHEYMLHYRMTTQKQVSPKLSILHQISTKTNYDGTAGYGPVNDGIYTRLATVTYTPDNQTTITAGKNAYWLAGGILGDDYIKGVDITRNLGNNTSLEVLHGRYWLPTTTAAGDTASNQITYAGLNSKIGSVNVGAHYLTGQYSLIGDPDPKIWLLTAGRDLGNSGINLSGGYAENTGADGHNKLTKVQLYKKVGKTDVIAQYWKQEANLNLPIENGDHMTWWGHEYSHNGIEGYRLIAVHPWSVNSYSEFFYGDYKNIKTDEKAKKYGWTLTFCY